MFMVLPSYYVRFQPEPDCDYREWQVNTEEALDTFCKILRLNDIHDYTIKRCQFGVEQIQEESV